MASIRDIAKIAEVSIATASFVLNAKGDQMRISEVTQKKILDAANELKYRPNISARRLRVGDGKTVPVIAIFWTMDSRAPLLGRFLQGIQRHYSQHTREFELLIQPYHNSNIEKIDSLITGTRFNGAIIAYASESDRNYLENTNLKVPIVMYQRDSKKHSSVKVDNYDMGVKVAELLANRGHKTAGLIVPDLSSQSIDLTKEGFINGCQSQGLQLLPEHIIYGRASGEGGFHSTKELIKKGDPPSAVFYPNDTMAASGLAAFHEAGIRIPQDTEIIGVGNYEHTQFTIPSLSVVHLPEEDMAYTCLNTLMDLLENKVAGPVSTILETSFVFRQSCGGFRDPQ
jgi:LacI family transcriptional regulator